MCDQKEVVRYSTKKCESLFGRARFANIGNRTKGELTIRVMCPVCGGTGGQTLYKTPNRYNSITQPVFGYQPSCHKCHERGERILMHPASNDEIECSWDDVLKFAPYILSLFEYDGPNGTFAPWEKEVES